MSNPLPGRNKAWTRREFVGGAALALTGGALAAAFPTVTRVAQAQQAPAAPVEFRSKGLRCRGLKFLPEGLRSGEKRPAIVLAHGFSAVKEMYFTHYAAEFGKAGFVAVVFDYRFQGESEGEPRGQIFPWEQIEDFRNAITFAQIQPEVDADRIGIFGSSYSGGHVICIGALDRRVKCVACQVPLIDGWANAQAINPRAALAGFLKFLEGDRVERYKSGKVNYLPVVAEDNNAVLNTSDSYQWFTETAKKMAPRWENRVTVESLEKFLEYSPAVFLPRVSPTPLLMMVAEHDILTPTDLAISAFESAREPKRLVVLPGGHFDAYVKGFPISSGNAVQWFKQWLMA
jgi:fermentation-respiration switch protein FrsA (DUF1100 family)